MNVHIMESRVINLCEYEFQQWWKDAKELYDKKYLLNCAYYVIKNNKLSASRQNVIQNVILKRNKLSEIYNWCLANTKQNVIINEIEKVHLLTTVKNIEEGDNVLKLYFDSKDDMMLFKLTWG